MILTTENQMNKLSVPGIDDSVYTEWQPLLEGSRNDYVVGTVYIQTGRCTVEEESDEVECDSEEDKEEGHLVPDELQHNRVEGTQEEIPKHRDFITVNKRHRH